MAVAIADPGHSGRGDRDNSDRNWGGSRGGSNRGGDDRGDRRGNGGENRKSDDGFRGDDDGPSFGNNDAPQSRVGSGRTEIQQLSPGEVSSVRAPARQTGPAPITLARRTRTSTRRG